MVVFFQVQVIKDFYVAIVFIVNPAEGAICLYLSEKGVYFGEEFSVSFSYGPAQGLGPSNGEADLYIRIITPIQKGDIGIGDGPEQAFYMVGGAEDAMRKAKDLEK